VAALPVAMWQPSPSLVPLETNTVFIQVLDPLYHPGTVMMDSKNSLGTSTTSHQVKPATLDASVQFVNVCQNVQSEGFFWQRFHTERGSRADRDRDTAVKVAHAHIHTHAHTYTQTHTHTRTHTMAHSHTHTHTYIHTHTHTHTHTHAHTHTGTHTGIHAHTRMHARTHTHTSARTHARLLRVTVMIYMLSHVEEALPL